MRRWLVLGWFLSLISACGDGERKVLTSPRPNLGGGSGTSSGSGGTATGGDDGMGGEPSSGTGGSSGTSGTTGSLDPGEIYLLGTLSEGNTSARALAKVSDPNLAILGFPSNSGSTTARMLDGDVVYQTVVNGVDVRRFVPDSQTRSGYNASTYPRMPEANDPILPTEPCGASNGNGLISFLTGPNGRFVYECADGWYEDGEERSTGGFPLFALGNDDLAVIDGVGIVDIASGNMLAGRPFMNPIQAARSFDGGFYVVDIDDTLWELTESGDITDLGAYPPPLSSPLQQTSKLGPDNALYQIATDLASEVIIRRTIDGDSDVIWSEADLPNVKAEPFTSVLITGP